MLFSFSYTHDQNSIYGDMPYLAKTHWFCNWPDKEHNHDLFFGLPSTIITTTLRNSKEKNWFRVSCVHENHLNRKHKVLLGARLDYNNNGAIFTQDCL
jgi:outer membrane receptor for ferrienterochelin and colicins